MRLRASPSLRPKETIYGIDNHFDDVDVLPLVETTDVVSLCNGTFVENEVDSACMILHKKPVTNILTSTVYRGVAYDDVYC